MGLVGSKGKVGVSICIVPLGDPADQLIAKAPGQAIAFSGQEHRGSLLRPMVHIWKFLWMLRFHTVGRDLGGFPGQSKHLQLKTCPNYVSRPPEMETSITP